MSLSDDKRRVLAGHPSLNLFKRRRSGLDRARGVAKDVAREARKRGNGAPLDEETERSFRSSVELFLRGQMLVEMHLACLASYIARMDEAGLECVEDILAEESERLQESLTPEARELVRATTWFRTWVEGLEKKGTNGSLREELEWAFEFAALLARKGLGEQGTATVEDSQ